MGRTACTEAQCLYKGDLYLYFKSNIIACFDIEFSRNVQFSKDKLTVVMTTFGKTIVRTDRL